MTELTLPGARVIFSTRRGGVSDGPYASLNLGLLTDDDRVLVAENRRRLAETAALASDSVASGRQVHGAELVEWNHPPEGPPPEADGHLTRDAAIGLLVLTADCYPVALSDGAGAAAVHCGWRGLAAGILESAVARLEQPAAAVGPGIGRCCYDVGPEVLGAFSDLDGVASGRMLDLRAVITAKLAAAGVTAVEHVDHCTSCRPELYFSHRRDRGVTGRQGALVRLDA